jgi:hypothetical protein
MNSTPLQPPVSWSHDLKKAITKQDTETLREIISYADKLSLAKLEARDDGGVDPSETPDEWDPDQWQDAIKNAYGEVPVSYGNGWITVTEISGRGYYYLECYHDGQFYSQYIAPVFQFYPELRT